MDYNRDKFEQYAAQMGKKDFELNEFDNYRNPFTQGPWDFWRASRDALTALSDAAQAPEPDCWAILTPNGSRLVSPEEAKGRRDAYPLYAAPVAADATAPTHADDTAVDEFAAVMKEKLAQARAKGRGGWETCNPADLSRMLREHVEKGDPRDVANFCMFLWFHRSPITSTQPDESAAFDLPPLPAPLEIDWPELHSHALGCGVEDRNILDRYEAAEYGWLDGADKAAERVPEEIFTADQMREYALAAVARATAPQAQPDERAAPTDSIPLHEDMLRALEHVECVYRQNVVKDGEPSSTLANLQRVIARARATAPQARSLTRESIQQKALDHGFAYWRAPDAHGVTGTKPQFIELLQDLLGVEVEIEDNGCQVCDGTGVIGGPSYYAPDEGGVPCECCATPAQAGATLTDEQIISQFYIHTVMDDEPLFTFDRKSALELARALLDAQAEK